MVTPADEEPLAAAGLRITPSRKERLYVGLMEIVEIFKRPRGRLVISYPKVTAAGEQRPSTVISELCGMLSEGGLPLAVADIDASAHRPEGSPERARLARTRFCASGACAYEILKGLRTAEGAHMRGAAYRFLSAADKARIDRVYARALPPAEVAATRGVGTTSASRLEKFFSCPYRYFFAYRLGLKERREAGMESTDSGIILHYALEKLFKAIAADEVNDENIDGMTREFFDEAVEATSNVALVRDDPATVRAAGDAVDIWLPDFKYSDDALGREYSGAENCFSRSVAAISAMRALRGRDVFDERGMMREGVIVRHLVLPGAIENTKGVLRAIAGIDREMYVSLMGQYFPTPAVADHPVLSRRLTEEEYDEATEEFFRAGLANGFAQELSSATEEYVPDFDSEPLRELVGRLRAEG